MRNRRLLTLAVLAVAIGFSAYAQAADNTDPYGTAVLTVIQQDPNVITGIGVYTMNVRLWGDGGVGTTAQTPGLLDFVIKNIAGTGDATVKTAVIIAPYGIVSNVGSEDPNYGGGFSDRDKRGVRYAGPNFNTAKVLIPNSFNAVGYQPVAYDANTGPNVPLRDAAILYGVGTTGRTAGAPTQNASVYANGSWISDPGDFAGDTPIISGTYQGVGGIAVTTWGTESFDVLPGTPSSVFTGPSIDANTFGRPVKAVIIQTTTGSGNDGGASLSANPITLRVAAGNVILGTSYASDNKTTLVIDANSTSVTLRGTNRVLSNLTLGTGITDAPSYKGLDVNATKVDIFAPDPVGKSGELKALIVAYAGAGTSGLYTSQTLAANNQLVVSPVDTNADATYDMVSILATVKGDANLDRTVADADFTILAANWQQTGRAWTQGDFTGDGQVEDADFTVLAANWQQTFTPGGVWAAPIAVPEPATMSLLGLGLLGFLHRRKK